VAGLSPYTEYHPGGSEFIHLRNFPLQSVTSVNFDPGYVFGSGTILSSTSYVVHTDRGVIQSLVGPFAPRVDRQGLVNRHVYNWTKGPRVLQVIYTVAAAAPPDDLLGAYALLIGHWYRLIKTQVAVNFQNIRQQKFGDAFTTYNAAESGGLPIPPDVYLLLAAHRVPNL